MSLITYPTPISEIFILLYSSFAFDGIFSTTPQSAPHFDLSLSLSLAEPTEPKRWNSYESSTRGLSSGFLTNSPECTTHSTNCNCCISSVFPLAKEHQIVGAGGCSMTRDLRGGTWAYGIPADSHRHHDKSTIFTSPHRAIPMHM